MTSINLRVRRTIGLGDQISALGAIHGWKQGRVNEEALFEGNDDLFVLSGLSPQEPYQYARGAKYVNLDEADPQHAGDRAQHYADLMGSPRALFPLPWPTAGTVAKHGRIVFAPWCKGRALTRSLSEAVIAEVAQKTDCLLVHHEQSSRRFEGCVDLQGRVTTLPALLECVAGSRGVIAIDSGIAYFAASLGIPTVILYTHFQGHSESYTSLPWVKAFHSPHCAKPCGDFAWPNCPCWGTERFASCSQRITAEEILSCAFSS